MGSELCNIQQAVMCSQYCEIHRVNIDHVTHTYCESVTDHIAKNMYNRPLDRSSALTTRKEYIHDNTHRMYLPSPSSPHPLSGQ